MNPVEMRSLSRGEMLRLGIKIIVEMISSRGRNLVYLPRRYDSNPDYAQWKTSLEQVRYESGPIKMSAFLDCGPRATPESIWLLFGGNASVALDWLTVTFFAPPSSDAFVLFDYPGFGDSEGKPDRKLIQRCIDDLIEKLAARFSIERSDVGNRFKVMGHSLGSAVALETAVRHSIRKGILIAPFTSVQKMGEKMFGKIIPMLAADRYDNLKSIRELTAAKAELNLHIIHGLQDDIIPVSMARELHEAFPGHTTLWEIPDANHNDILLLLSKELGCALTNGGDFSYVSNK